MFCVECGREGETFGALCRDCYAKKHLVATLPDHVDLVLCSHCSSAEIGGQWVDVGSVREAAESVIEDAVVVAKEIHVSLAGIRLEEKDERNLRAVVGLSLSSQGVEAGRELETVVRIKRGSCTECSKMHGSYYEAILQVRGREGDLGEAESAEVQGKVLARIASMRKSSRAVFLTKTEKVRGGLDFYISTTSAAKTIARELQDSWCAEYKESSSLWGRRGGREVHRMTFLVRLPGFAPGDVVEFGSDEILVQGMSRGVVRGVDIRSGQPMEVRSQDVSGCSLVLRTKELKQAVVLSESDDEVQVLDPYTMSPLDLRKPLGFSRKGEKVRLAKTKRGSFLLSDDW